MRIRNFDDLNMKDYVEKILDAKKCGKDKWDDVYDTINIIRSKAAFIHESVNQKYDDMPYVSHLDLAMNFLIVFLYLTYSENDKKVKMCDFLNMVFGVYFHDVIEDCRITYNDLKRLAKEMSQVIPQDVKYFEDGVDIVYACTEEKGKNREERHNAKYFDGIRNTWNAYAVKIADIAANTTYSYATNPKRCEMYMSEFEVNYRLLYPRIYENNEFKETANNYVKIAYCYMKNKEFIADYAETFIKQ